MMIQKDSNAKNGEIIFVAALKTSKKAEFFGLTR
jgi:hypothetical protein